jgi:hypothetical protein
MRHLKKSGCPKGDTKRVIHRGHSFQDLCIPELSNGLMNARRFASPRLKMFVLLFFILFIQNPWEGIVRIKVIISLSFTK